MSDPRDRNDRLDPKEFYRQYQAVPPSPMPPICCCRHVQEDHQALGGQCRHPGCRCARFRWDREPAGRGYAARTLPDLHVTDLPAEQQLRVLGDGEVIFIGEPRPITEAFAELAVATIHQPPQRGWFHERITSCISVPADWRIVGELRGGPLTTRELAGRLRLSWADCSRVVQHLRRHGVVLKQDRRYRLTERPQQYPRLDRMPRCWSGDVPPPINRKQRRAERRARRGV